MIKEKKIDDKEKLLAIRHEKSILAEKLKYLDLDGIDSFLSQLFEVNSLLWNVEDSLRVHEKKESFGKQFVEQARSVYKLNDERFLIKKSINELYNSEVHEVKSYA